MLDQKPRCKKPKYKKQKYKKKSYESDCSCSDTSANIYHSMLKSKAWKDLSAKQQSLYLVCKDQVYAQKTQYKPDPDDPSKFYMNRYVWLYDYELYPESNEAGFYQDMGALIMHGFIRCIESGQPSKTKSIYQFSDKWQKYWTPEFEISPQEMNMHLLNKIRRKKEQ